MNPTVVGVILGAVIAGIAGILSNWVAARTTLGARREELEAGQLAARRALQRETLQELQGALSEVAPAENSAYMVEDEAGARANESRQRQGWSRVNTLKVRVLDDIVRYYIDQMENESRTATQASIGGSTAETYGALNAISAGQRLANVHCLWLSR